MKTIISSNAGMVTNLDTQYVPSTEQISIKISTTYEHSEDPKYARTSLQLCLNRTELRDLAFGLIQALDDNFELPRKVA